MSTRKTKSHESGISLTKKDSNSLVQKVGAVSDSTKALSKEIKSMTKIFVDNQKVLLSMKEMIDTLTTTLEQIQKQSKQLNLIEEDNQRLYAGLNQVRSQADLVSKINGHTNRLQDQVNKITQVQKESPNSDTIMKAVSDNQNSIQNNTHMIIKIARRIDTIKEDLDNTSSKTETLSIKEELVNLKEKIRIIHDKSEKANLESDMNSLKQNLADLMTKTNETGNAVTELDAIKDKISSISERTEKIGSLGDKIHNLQNELILNVAKTESIIHLRGDVAKITTKVNSLVKRADATAFVGEGLKSVQLDLADLKENISNKTNTIDQKISTVSELLKKVDASSAESHKKADNLAHSVQEIKNLTDVSSDNTSKEVMALLKLSEFQSNVRIISESKYGDLKDIEKIGEQTVSLVNLFDKIAIESQQNVSLPQEIQTWAISKMLDCADKWEIRFSDLFNMMIHKLGKVILKENIRIQQIRDIFGIRAVDEIRKELDLATSD